MWWPWVTKTSSRSRIPGQAIAQPRRAEPLDDPGPGPPAAIASVLERQGPARPRVESPSSSGSARRCRGSGDEDDLDLADHLAGSSKNGRARSSGVRGELAQLDHVAEQDHTVGAGELLEQDPRASRVAQHVLVARDAEVEVGDDRPLHRPFLPVVVPPLSPYSRQRTNADLARRPASAGSTPRCIASVTSSWPANGIELCYQEIGDPDGEPLLLVMGLGDADDRLGRRASARCSPTRGFRVVRFDNRDIGRSTHLDDAPVPEPRRDAARRRRADAPYTLRRHGRRRRRAARRPRLGRRARGRRLDGRDDRPDARDPAPGARALA